MKQWSSSSCLSRASSFKDLLSTTRRHAASAARPRPTEQPEYYFFRPFVLVERIVFSADMRKLMQRQRRQILIINHFCYSISSNG